MHPHFDADYGEYEVLDETNEDAWRKLTLFEAPMIRFKDYQQILPNGFLKISKRIHDFETRDDDVWIVSHCKSGSTWMGELTWCLMNNLDFEKAKKINLDLRMTYLEINAVSMECQQHLIPKDVIEEANQSKSPRLLKTHLSFEMLPKQILQKKNKIIYMLRNPRDVCISLYNHHRILHNYQATMEEHVEHFLSGTCGYYMPYDKNINGFLKQKDLSHILFVTYEEMKKDLSLVVDKVGDFLGLPRLEEEAKSELLDHLSIGKMKENPSVNRGEASKAYVKNGSFINKGIVGNWKSTFTTDMIQRFEEWEKDKWEDFNFTYEL